MRNTWKFFAFSLICLVLTFQSKTLARPDLINKADAILSKSRIYSVMDKVQIPPSGDKHDYMSQGPYWWPDTTKKDGKPYIRRDGYVIRRSI